MDDYSCIAFPSLRVLEGVIRRILLQNGIINHITTPVGSFFDNISVGNFCLKAEFSKKMTPDVARVVNSLYSYYNRMRHQYGHAGSSDLDTAIIADRSVANSLLFDTLGLIEKACK